jgi:hypothetical protein
MKNSQYGPCGLYCGACGALDCDGCRSERVDDWMKQCQFRQCASEKNVDSCCFCRDYPCKALHEFMHDKWPHHWTMQPNLEYIKKNGAEKWLLAQQQEWSCKSCAAAIHWHQKQCRCGQQLEAWELPA